MVGEVGGEGFGSHFGVCIGMKLGVWRQGGMR